MIGARFAILTYSDPGALINASADRNGRPGSWQQVGIPPDTTIASIVALPCPMDGHPEAFRLLITYNIAEPPPQHLLRDEENERVGYLLRIETRAGEVALRCEGCGSLATIGISPSFEEVEAAVAFHRANVHDEGSA